MPQTTPRRTFCWTADRLALAGLLVFTLFVRGGVLWAMRANFRQDPDAYREIAENLLRYGEFALGKPFRDDGVSRPIPTACEPCPGNRSANFVGVIELDGKSGPTRGIEPMRQRRSGA